MKKAIALATGDWHLNDWKQFNENDRRIRVSDDFLHHILSLSHNEGIPILMTGDMFHTPDNLSNKLLDHYSDFFNKARVNYEKAMIYGITGNHDLRLNGEGYYSYVKTFSKLHCPLISCIDNIRVGIYNDIMVCGIPYTKNNAGFKESMKKHLESYPDYRKILLIHTSLYGAKDPNGYEIDEVPGIDRNLGKMFKGFDLVLSGHIHLHSRLWKEKVYMVGAPYHQRSSDTGAVMGYMLIYDDLSTKFIYYKAPEFIFYSKGDLNDQGEPLPDDFNYCIEKPKSSLRKGEDSQNTFSNIKDRTILAKEYFKLKGIKNKSRLNLLIKLLNSVEE